jgi:diguanylate cyclase (GGDEF)-like protein/PAS domain S-box-containing protein
MYRIFTCLAVEHNLWLVVLAAVLCLLSNLANASFIGRAREIDGTSRLVWVAVGAAAGGFGIWATHFVAMLAYDPGMSLAFDLGWTLASLLLGCLATLAAGFLVITLPGRQGSVSAGVIFGLGVSCMHFTGMSAMEFGGTIVWDRALVIAAVVAPVVAASLAFGMLRVANTRAIVAAAVVLSLGIVAMHFVAMGAVTLVPDPSLPMPEGALSRTLMVVTLVVVSLTLIGSGLAASIVTSRAARSSKASEASFQLLVNNIIDYALYMLDPDGVVTNWNSGAERAKGYTAAEIVGSNFARFYSPEDQAKGVPAMALRTARDVGRFEAEGRRYRKDGSWFWAHVVIHPIRNAEGRLIGYTKITRDVTRERADSDHIAAVTQSLDLALQNMTQGICLFNSEERLILCNNRYREIFQLPEGAVYPGLSYAEMVLKGFLVAVGDPEEARIRAEQHYNRTMEAVRSGQNLLLLRSVAGRTIRVAFSLVPSGGWVSTFEDITEQVRSDEQIAFMVEHDGLTRLPNRGALMSTLAAEIERAEREKETLAVIGVDLNKFKQINDQLGHAVGDEVLKAVADRLRQSLKPHEQVARFGGDEFVAVKRYASLTELQEFLDRLSEAFSLPLQIGGHRLSPGASMGVALYPNDGRSPEALIANADLAMYRAKGSLSRSVCFYDVGMDESARDRTKMAEDLWSAIDEKQLRLHYQVQKSVSTGEITGYEVLLRWHHPERGNVPPADFIPVAEECGAILPLGEWVLREACREAATWPNDHKVAVNLSPVQIAHMDMPKIVHSVLLDTGLQPRRLELEITESSIIQDKQRALHALREIKALGVSIAMDDFGTGYSSMETLRSFPFDKIKLDRSFLAGVDKSDEAKAMVRAVLALGQGLRIPVLAEGVETQLQLDMLRHEGCHEAQGYLLGRPMPMGDQPVTKAA